MNLSSVLKFSGIFYVAIGIWFIIGGLLVSNIIELYDEDFISTIMMSNIFSFGSNILLVLIGVSFIILSLRKDASRIANATILTCVLLFCIWYIVFLNSCLPIVSYFAEIQNPFEAANYMILPLSTATIIIPFIVPVIFIILKLYRNTSK